MATNMEAVLLNNEHKTESKSNREKATTTTTTKTREKLFRRREKNWNFVQTKHFEELLQTMKWNIREEKHRIRNGKWKLWTEKWWWWYIISVGLSSVTLCPIVVASTHESWTIKYSNLILRMIFQLERVYLTINTALSCDSPTAVCLKWRGNGRAHSVRAQTSKMNRHISFKSFNW